MYFLARVSAAGAPSRERGTRGHRSGPHDRVEGFQVVPVVAPLEKDPARIARYLAWVGEPTEPPARSPDRGPPYWRSTILRRRALGYEDA